MTNKEILEKAIQKAIDGGWPTALASTMVEWNVYDDPYSGAKLGVAQKLADKLVRVQAYEEIIFDKSFAKALWPEGTCTCGEIHKHGELIEEKSWRSSAHNPRLDWRYHLQQMVIAEDPIKYLGESL